MQAFCRWKLSNSSSCVSGRRFMLATGLAAMIPNPRRINPQADPRWFERSRERVLRLMERSSFIGRDVAGLGAEPPPPAESVGHENALDSLIEFPN